MKTKPSGPAFRCYGGKWESGPKILKYFPPHTHYVEPYCGSASLLFLKRPSRIETINDLDGDIIHFFKMLRTRGEDLVRELELTMYSRQELAEARAYSGNGDLERARTFFVRVNQSWGGGDKGSWRYSRTVFRRGMSQTVSGWCSRVGSLIWFYNRLKFVQIECAPATDVIKTHGQDPTTLIYADPPYLHSTRVSVDVYGQFEMALKDHQDLLALLQSVKAMVVLSGYSNDLYNTYLEDWKIIEFSVPLRENRGNRRVECLWINPWAYKVWQASKARGK